MDTTKKPVLKTTLIESSAKFFGLSEGASQGSMIQETYDIPEGMTPTELRRFRLETKEILDKDALVMELARGSITNAQYQMRMGLLISNYDRILKRKKEADDSTAK